MNHWTSEQLALLEPSAFEEGTHLGGLHTLVCTDLNAQQRLNSLMDRTGVGLIDTRSNPRGRGLQAFQQAALIERYGVIRYGHCPVPVNAQGNKTDELLEFPLPFAGLRQIVHLLQGGRTLVLLFAKLPHQKYVYAQIISLLAQIGTTLFTIELDSVTQNYRARWLLPDHEEPQWFHEHSLTGPETEEKAKLDVWRTIPNALSMPSAQFTERCFALKEEMCYADNSR